MPKRSTLVLLLVLGTAGVALVGCGGGGENEDEDEVAGGGDEITVQLAEQSGSGQTGTATLTEAGDNQTRVVIEIDDPVSPSQPAHIHEGTCDDLTAAPAYGLPNVQDGKVDATVEVSVDDLELDGPYAINLHMSDDDAETYTSCGNIED